MHEKEFFILTNKCGNKLNKEACGITRKRGMTWSLVFVLKLISIFIDKNPKIFFAHVLKKDVLLLCA
jgi:hypothetical protein